MWHRAHVTKSPHPVVVVVAVVVVSIPRFWGAGGKAGEGRYGPGGQPGPEMVIIQ